MQNEKNPLVEGTPVLIRTVTHYYTGRVVAVSDADILLEDAAWITDTGRFNAALVKGDLEEVEPFPDPVLVNRGAVVDITRWAHDLPRAVK